MLQIQRVSRRSLLEGWTPGLILGVFLYALAVLVLHLLSDRAGWNFTPCLFLHATGLPCPLCGGTRASIALVTGKPLSAFLLNPMVTVALLGIGGWLFLQITFGLRARFKGGERVFLFFWLFLGLINWAYLLLVRGEANAVVLPPP